MKRFLTLDNIIIAISFLIFGYFVLGIFSCSIERPIGIILLSFAFLFTIIVFLFNKFRFKKSPILIKYLILFICTFIFFVILYGISIFYYTIPQPVAETKDIKKAVEIQKIYPNDSVIHVGTEGEYWVTLQHNPHKYLIIAEIAKKYRSDNSVNIHCGDLVLSRLFTKRIFENSHKEIFKHIKGVSSADIELINYPKSYKDRTTTYDAIIDIKILEGYDEKEIYETINKILDKRSKNNKINISIKKAHADTVYKRYQNRIYDLFAEEKYGEAIELAKIAKTKLPQEYNDNFDTIIKEYTAVKKLDEQIKKHPNNYKLYVKRGNIFIRNYFHPYIFEKFSLAYYMTDNWQQAEKDYEKALQLNSQYYELNEIIGDINYYPIKGVKKLDKKYKQKALKYYFIALKYTKQKDGLYEKIGDIYYYTKDYETALKYYNQIENKEGLILKNIKKDNNIDTSSNWHSRNNLYYRIYLCQKKLKLYEQALDTCNEALKNSNDNSFNKGEIRRSIYIIDLKMKNFKKAKNDLLQCPYTFCILSPILTE